MWWIKGSESNGQTENYDHTKWDIGYEFIYFRHHIFARPVL